MEALIQGYYQGYAEGTKKDGKNWLALKVMDQSNKTFYIFCKQKRFKDSKIGDKIEDHVNFSTYIMKETGRSQTFMEEIE